MELVIRYLPLSSMTFQMVKWLKYDYSFRLRYKEDCFEQYLIVRGIYIYIYIMILSTKVNVMVIRRFCLKDDEEGVFWVIRFHVVKNRWSCPSIEFVLIKVRSMVNDVLYIVIIIGSIKAWWFNLFWELLIWTWNLEVVKNCFLIQLWYIYIHIYNLCILNCMGEQAPVCFELQNKLLELKPK